MLRTAVDHRDKKYKCEKMSACIYTGTTIVNKIPWAEEAGAQLPMEKEKENTGGKKGLRAKGGCQ